MFHLQRRLDDGYILIDIPLQRRDINLLTDGSSHVQCLYAINQSEYQPDSFKRESRPNESHRCVKNIPVRAGRRALHPQHIPGPRPSSSSNWVCGARLTAHFSRARKPVAQLVANRTNTRCTLRAAPHRQTRSSCRRIHSSGESSCRQGCKYTALPRGTVFPFN